MGWGHGARLGTQFDHHGCLWRNELVCPHINFFSKIRSWYIGPRWDYYWVKSGRITVTTSNFDNDVSFFSWTGEGCSSSLPLLNQVVISADEATNTDPTNPNVKTITIIPTLVHWTYCQWAMLRNGVPVLDIHGASCNCQCVSSFLFVLSEYFAFKTWFDSGDYCSSSRLRGQ